MHAIFKDRIGRNLEVYIDDMVIKSKHHSSLLDDLKETFDNLRRYRLKLNPKKCTFGVPSGKFLGYLVSQRGMEANPDKVKAVLDMKTPTSVREVQRLNGRIVTLGRFFSKVWERCLPKPFASLGAPPECKKLGGSTCVWIRTEQLLNHLRP